MTASPERFHGLLADQALDGLSPEEARELAAFLAEHPDADINANPESYELAVAASVLAFLPAEAGLEAMPEHVERAVLERARAFVVAQAAVTAPAGTAATARVLPMNRPVAPEARTERRGRGAGSAGWWAAAACLALAVAGWWPGRVAQAPEPVIVESVEQPAPASPEVRLAQAADRLAIDWQPTEDPAVADTGAGGEVVWSGQIQQGYMRFRGLPANDPSKSQYQLWIFDADQDERYPIDGGVFDVPAGQAEVVVPIDPKLRVARPTLFAVTVEKPGGVVVSSRERIVLVAPRA